MAHLPPTGWADVATKQDIAGLRELTTVRFEAVEQRMATKQDVATLTADIAELKAHMDETLRKQLVTTVSCMVGLVSGMAGLLGVGAAVF